MSEWKTIEIGRSSYLRGRIGWQGLRAEEFIEEGPFLVTGTDFQNGKINWSSCYHVGERRFREASYIHLKDGDLLITKDGTIGKIAHVDNCPEQAVLNSGVFLLRCADGSYSHRFLYHVLRSFIFDDFLRLNLAGSTITHLYQYVFERFSFAAPSPDGQHRICRVLDLLEQQITHSEALIVKQEQVRTGLMQDLFTRGVDETGRLRPPREDAPELYHETALGWLPKGWQAIALEKLLAPVNPPMRSGPFGSSLRAHELVEVGVPLLGIDNIHIERFEAIFSRFVSPTKASELLRYRAFPGDVVITIMGTVGRACVIPEGYGDLLSSKHLWTMTFDTERVVTRLIAWQLNFAPWVKAWFRKETQGGIMDAIQSSTLRTLLLPVPPPVEQKRIAARYDTATNLLSQLRADFEKLGRVRTALLRDLFTPPGAAAEPRIAAE